MVLAGSYEVNSTNYATSINQYDIENVLRSNIQMGIIPFPSSSRTSNCYNFFPSEDVRIDKSGGGTADCLSVCGFHSSFTMTYIGVTNALIEYTVTANQASRNNEVQKCACTWWAENALDSPNGNYIADSFIYILSHEIGELVTDSTRGWNFCYGCDQEVGDLCCWRTGTGSAGDFLYYQFKNVNNKTAQANILVDSNYYHVNALWVNYGKGCCSVSWPFDYSHGETYFC